MTKNIVVDEQLFKTKIINKKDWLTLHQTDKVTGETHKVVINKELLEKIEYR